jgi:hypothetical protein
MMEIAVALLAIVGVAAVGLSFARTSDDDDIDLKEYDDWERLR